MNESRLQRVITSGAFLVVILIPSVSEACSVCMGDPASKTANALNNAIFLMLGFIGLMLAGVGAFIFNLMQRAKSPLPPHQQFAQSLNQDSPLS